MKIGIVCTAGRKSAQNFMTKENYGQMIKVAEDIIKKYDIQTVISGGAAFSDHVAVNLFINGKVNNLILMLPDIFDVPFNKYKDNHYGNISNELHKTFSQQCKIDSMSEISKAILQGAIIPEQCLKKSYGFIPRNTLIAVESDIILAFTSGNPNNQIVTDFGKDPTLSDTIISDNGTRDTWKKAVKKHRIVASIMQMENQRKNLISTTLF